MTNESRAWIWDQEWTSLSLGMIGREVWEGTVEPDGRDEELCRGEGRLPAHDEDACNATGLGGAVTRWSPTFLRTGSRDPVSEVDLSPGIVASKVIKRDAGELE